MTQCCHFLCLVVADFHPKLFIGSTLGTDVNTFWKLPFSFGWSSVSGEMGVRSLEGKAGCTYFCLSSFNNTRREDCLAT